MLHLCYYFVMNVVANLKTNNNNIDISIKTSYYNSKADIIFDNNKPASTIYHRTIFKITKKHNKFKVKSKLLKGKGKLLSCKLGNRRE